MKLYTDAVSPNCRKAHAVAVHAGVELEHETVDLRAGEQKRPEFLELNPMGKVPVLVDGGTVLWESNAIACRIGARGAGGLWPREAERQYDLMRWLYWECAHWIRPIGAILGQVVFNRDNPDAAIIEKGRNDFRPLAGVLDGHLATREFLSGEGPTVAEYAVGVWLGYTELCGLPLAEFAHLSAWSARLRELPGWPAAAPPNM